MLNIRRALIRGTMVGAVALAGLVATAGAASASENCSVLNSTAEYYYGLSNAYYGIASNYASAGDPYDAGWAITEAESYYQTATSYTQEYQRCNLHQP